MQGDGIARQHKQTLLKIFATCLYSEGVILFGSRAMGSYTTESDIDLALLGDIPLAEQARMTGAIEQTNIPQQVDIVLYRTITDEKLLQHIKEYGVVWKLDKLAVK